MTTNIRLVAVSVGLTLSFLHGCGGSSSNSVAPLPEPPPPDPRPTSVPDINPPQAFAGKLVQPGAAGFAQYLKNGVFASRDVGVRESAPPSSAPTVTGADSNFSTTNTQETGVDEADRIEYDGEVLYIASNPNWYDPESRANVRVMQRAEDFTLSQVSTIDMGGENYNIDGLYLNGQRLAAIGSNQPRFTIGILPVEPIGFDTSTIELGIFDTSDAAAPLGITNLSIDGRLVSSRRIGNDLFIVSSYYPNVEPLESEGTDEEQRLANYLAVLDKPMSDLMPHIREGESSVPLNNPEDCYIPEEATEADGSPQLLTITRINMDNPQERVSSCLGIYAYQMYMSAENLYLFAGLQDETLFHKVALGDLSYQATGAVPGYVSGRGNASLRMDEEDGLFRVLTSQFGEETLEHRLFVMEQQGSELQTIVQLPNEDQPEAIGKPGEDVFAVRFVGDKGYIVTFERIDPLYVIDFANPRAPVIAGSLEIPGFSSYLHPMDNGFLLGVGQQVDPGRLPEEGSVPVDPPVIEQGMKVSLFDVRDPANPTEVGSIVQSNAYTPVEWDYRALAVVEQDGVYRFAMPYETWGNPGPLRTSVIAALNRLMLLEVDTLAAQPSLQFVNQIAAENKSEVYTYGGYDRSVIHGNHVFYVHGSNVWISEWLEEGDVTGPF